MKKMITLITLVGLSSVAVAQGFHDGKDGKSPERHHDRPQKMQPHGFFDPANAVKTVKDAQTAKDDTFVMIEGKITKQVGKKAFIFQDATGEMEIEISRKAWNGQTISPEDTVEIRGKVDKEWNKTEIEVKQIIKK